MPMEETSVLANKFVPGHLRAINLAPFNQQVFACHLPSLTNAIRQLQQELAPLSECKCHDLKESDRHSFKVPQVRLEPEYNFALTNKGEEDGSTNKSNSAATPEQLSSASIHEYAKAFTELLQQERHTLLHLYERYSLYLAPILTLSDRHARFFAPGLADARPAVLSGDIVLIRPMRNISIPTPLKGWSPPVIALQIQARVVQVQRGKKKRNKSGTNIPQADDDLEEESEGEAKKLDSLTSQQEQRQQRPSLPLVAGNDVDTVDITWINSSEQATLGATFPENRFNIRIIPSVLPQERCLTALHWISTTLSRSITQELLFPNEATSVPEVEFSSKQPPPQGWSEFNPRQQLFIRLVRARTLQPSLKTIRPPMILTGPAGTGKTKTLLASIFHLLEISTDHRILVCTPSHTAADVVTQRLSKRLSRAHLFRLVDPQRPIETLPPAILPHCRQDDQTGAFSLPHCDELFGFRVIVCTCSDASILYNLGFTNQQLGQQRACFAHQSLQLSQRLRLPSPPSEWALRCPVFTHLFVDEAAQATEPELAISLSVVVDNEAPFCEIGLVGDPRQLSPNIYCKKAADGGLEYSYMERLLRRPMNYLSGGFPFMLGNEDDVLLDLQQHRSCVFLTANYRGHVSFLMMPSALFYFDRLQVASTQTIESERYWIHKVQCLQNLAEPTTELALAWNQMPPSMFQTSQWSSVNPNMLQVRHQEWPIHFRGVKGKDKSVSVDSLAGSSSWSNPEEASAVVEIVATLVREGVASHGIGIMSPFRGQVVLIRKLLRERSMAGVDVGTVEDYQAVERVVTVLSLTRSSEKFLKTDINSRTGIFQQVKRANVALTRAENLLVVVGNPHLMVRDGVWKQFLWFCLRNGLWYGETINPEVLAEMQTKPINVVSYLPGEHHKLLGPADSIENPVVISSIEMALRRTY